MTIVEILLLKLLNYNMEKPIYKVDRLVWADCLKCFAILLVLLGHIILKNHVVEDDRFL